MKLKFIKIKNNSIFQPQFEDLSSVSTGTIEFKKLPHSSGGIAVVYAPNGTGKSTFANTVKCEISSDDISFEAQYNDGDLITPESKVFFIVGDQINRNIIPGETSDYLIGRDIRKEYALQKQLKKAFNEAFVEKLPSLFKDEFGVKRVSDYLLRRVENKHAVAYSFIKDIINKQSRGNGIKQEEFINFVTADLNLCKNETIDTEKYKFVVENSALIEELTKIHLDTSIENQEIRVIEQNDDAIPILKKYKKLGKCIVCDNDEYDAEQLLISKSDNRKRIYDSLDRATKNILDNIIMNPVLNVLDPFNIKHVVLDFISTGDSDALKTVLDEIEFLLNEIVVREIIAIHDVFEKSSVVSWFKEYSQLLESQPELDSDELLYIEKIISENISRSVHVIREGESDKNIKLMLDDQPLLNTPREEMHLSTGEQNFISLAFALLMAKHSNKEFIILDDPISSFDSIYKNKIAFCILKFLENKKQIILSHNVDLIRLLQYQLKDCFNLYMLNNSDFGVNGFIPIKREETNILINLYDMIKLFQNKDDMLLPFIKNQRLFLMSMIPFMRGYAHITKDEGDYYTKLSVLMHGFETAKVDLAKVYFDLFGYSFLSEVVSVNDVLTLDCANLEIIDSEQYPLLAKTLRQTLIYYHIRMLVEAKLISIFNIHVESGKILLLTNIIMKAFEAKQDATQEEKDMLRDYRVFFTSRKTLLNEFNHFEGNMNIFQPAIDIEDSVLKIEVKRIKSVLKELEDKYAKH